MILAASLGGEDFVGRRDELAFLQDEYRAACDGRARLVIVDGEAGIGKSRLLQEFARLTAPKSVARGYCSEQIRSPYLPLAAVLEAIDSRRAWLPAQERKAAFYGAVAEGVRRRCSRGLLVITIEDLQWADGATLELLAFLTARVQDSPLLLLLSMRSDAVASSPALAAFRAVASRTRCATLQLRGLRSNDIRNLVRQKLSRQAFQLPSETLSHIEFLSEGNPLFAEELAQLALQNGDLSFKGDVPVSLAAILGERLAPFGESERSALIRAAILGQVFDLSMLASIAETSIEELAPLMQRAVDRGLILEDAHSPLKFRFRHALIRTALADRLVVALAAPLHVRIAEALEGLEDDAPRTAELAYHWSAARIPEKARMWNERAAEQAWQVYAYRDAIRFYTEALRWQYPGGAARARVYEWLGILHYIEGSAEEPAAWFERCRAECDAAGDEDGAARAVLRLADQHWVDARTVDGLQAASDAAERARRIGNRTLVAQAQLSMARFAITLGRIGEACLHVREAQAALTPMDPETLAALHEIRGEIYAISGDRVRALDDLRLAAQLAAEARSPELVAQIENNGALGAVDLGDLHAATLRHENALREADRTGMMWRVAYCSLGFARTLTLLGDLEAARSHVWSALETGVRTATFKTKAAAVGIPLGLMLNDLALIERCACDEALEFAYSSGEAQRIAGVVAAFAELRAEQGAAEEAESLIAGALAHVAVAHRSWDLLLCAARFGRDGDVRRARELFAAAPGRPSVRRAHRLLFEALASRTADPVRSGRLAGVAAASFHALGDLLHRTQSLEIAAPEAALAIHRAMGNVRDVQKLQIPVAPKAPELTPRQAQIAQLAAQGETNRGIANRLHISEHTVEHHLSAIFERLNLRSRAQLAHFLVRSEES